MSEGEKSASKRAVRPLLVLGVMIAFIAFAFLVVVSYATTTTTNPVLNFFVENHMILMIMLACAGLLTGGLIVFVLSNELHTTQVAAANTADIVLQFLSADERTLIKHIAHAPDGVSQAEISRLPGFTRLRAHRTVQRLEQRHIVTVESHGKMNKIRLHPDMAVSLRRPE